MCTRWSVLLLFLISALAWAAPAPSKAQGHTALEEIFATLSPSPAKDTLLRIPDMGRRLLALRSYARFRAPLVTRWSWTEEEIKAFQGSDEQKALLAEVDAIKAHFAAANPGYELYAGTRVRSLDVQIRKWNANGSVGTGGAEILAAWEEKFGQAAEAGTPMPRKAFWQWIKSFRPSARARLAAPGLSRHGRARAIDFQIMKDGKIFGGTSVKAVVEIWRAQKWEEKLKASITAAGPSFSGPLKAPDEPWHYDYDPQVTAPPKPAE